MGREQQIAFDMLRKFLTTSPVLAYPDFEKEFIIHTDASLNAIGAVLSQLDEHNHDHPVTYCSRTLSSAERNYTVTEQECLAVIYAVKQFRVYVHRVKHKVVTNHSSLKWLQTLSEPEEKS